MFTFETIRCFLVLTVLAQNSLPHFNMASSITLKSSKIVYINQLLTTCKACVHTGDISTRSIQKQSMIYPLGLVNTKQQEVFFVSSFVLLFACASATCSYACAYVALYVAGLTAFLCFAFCLSCLVQCPQNNGNKSRLTKRS